MFTALFQFYWLQNFNQQRVFQKKWFMSWTVFFSRQSMVPHVLHKNPLQSSEFGVWWSLSQK
jgi:hypothetical protein